MTNSKENTRELSLQEQLMQTKARIQQLQQELRQTETEAARLRNEIAREMPTLGYAVLYERGRAGQWVRDEIMALTAKVQNYGNCMLSVEDGQMSFSSPSYYEGLNQQCSTSTVKPGEEAYEYDGDTMARFATTREEAEAQPEIIEEDDEL